MPLSMVKSNLTKYPCDFPQDFDLASYEVFRGVPHQILHDGDCLDLGGRKIQVLHTPGHSPGHCCFYETERKYLYTGDLIYKGCLYAFYPTTDPRLFNQSVKRVQKYEVAKLLPGHYALNVPASIIDDIAAAFDALDRNGQLMQGSGCFAFGDFQIHI